MILYSSYWKIFMQKPKRINMIILFLSVTIFATNAHILFRNGYVDIIEINSQMPNGSLTTTFEEHVSCYRARGDREYIFPRWERIHLALYNLVPFAIMVKQLCQLKVYRFFCLIIVFIWSWFVIRWSATTCG